MYSTIYCVIIICLDLFYLAVYIFCATYCLIIICFDLF